MQKKRRKPPLGSAMELSSGMSDQLWVRPNSNLIQPKETDGRNITPASGKKLLELADVALGLNERERSKKVEAACCGSASPTAAPTEKQTTATSELECHGDLRSTWRSLAVSSQRVHLN